MDHKHFTTREKLELMKQIDARNEQRRKEFAAQQTREARLYKLFEEGLITEEQLNEQLNKQQNN